VRCAGYKHRAGTGPSAASYVRNTSSAVSASLGPSKLFQRPDASHACDMFLAQLSYQVSSAQCTRARILCRAAHRRSCPPRAEPEYDPCIDNEVELYFNRPDVQAALHANTTGDLPGPWTSCTQRIAYSRRDLLSSMLPVYDELLKVRARARCSCAAWGEASGFRAYPCR